MNRDQMLAPDAGSFPSGDGLGAAQYQEGARAAQLGCPLLETMVFGHPFGPSVAWQRGSDLGVHEGAELGHAGRGVLESAGISHEGPDWVVAGFPGVDGGVVGGPVHRQSGEGCR